MREYTGNIPSSPLPETTEDVAITPPPLELTFTALVPAADLDKAREVTDNVTIELGGIAVPGSVNVRFAEVTPATPAPPTPQAKYELSAREFQTATLVAQGLDNKEIAQRLGLAEATVKGYLSSALGKTRTNNRTHLVVTLFGLTAPTD